MKANWYIIQVVSNFESIVKENLENKIFDEEGSGIEQVLLPTTTVVSKTGKTKKRVMFPGYLFVKINMSDNVWYIIRNTQYVTGIVGSSGQRTKPTPMQEHEIQAIISRMEKEKNAIQSGHTHSNPVHIDSLDYKIGDIVEILQGDFKGQFGNLKELVLENNDAIVEIEFFGRLTPVTLKTHHIKKK